MERKNVYKRQKKNRKVKTGNTQRYDVTPNVNEKFNFTNNVKIRNVF